MDFVPASLMDESKGKLDKSLRQKSEAVMLATEQERRDVVVLETSSQSSGSEPSDEKTGGAEGVPRVNV